MKTRCKQQNLMTGLSVVKRAVASRTPVAVYTHVLVSAQQDRLQLSATNQQISITCWIPAETEETGAMTVPGQLLTNFVNGLPDDWVNIGMHKAGKRLTVQCGTHNARMNGFDADEFPVDALSPEPHRTSPIDLDADKLIDMVDMTTFCASTDFSKPSINGVEVSMVGDSIQMVATDSFRLSRCLMFVENEIENHPPTVIIQAQHLNEISSIVAAGKTNAPVKYAIGRPEADAEPNQAVFIIKGDPEEDGGYIKAQISSQLVAAEYPVYKSFLPNAWKTRTAFNTSEFKQAVRVMRLFATEKSSPIDFEFNPADSTVTIKAKNLEMGNNESTLAAEIEGEPINISFGARYLTEVLGRIDSKTVIMETNATNTPATILAEGIKRDEFVHVVMPMYNPGG